MEKPLINPQREEYLVTIFKLMRDKKKITNKQISESLNLSPPSVTEILKKLTEDGLIEDGRSNALTDQGMKIAKLIISKHRLWEYFLQEKLKYNWTDIHEIANNLQSVTTDDLLNKLNAYLGYPDCCPHGSSIYINNEEKNEMLIKLKDATVGDSYIIRRIADDRKLLKYCESMGINISKKILIEGFDDFDNTVLVKIEDKNIRISPLASSDIFLKKLDD